MINVELMWTAVVECPKKKSRDLTYFIKVSIVITFCKEEKC